MTQVYLYFKEFELGFLTEKEGAFLWTPDSKNIHDCFQKYDGASDLFLLESQKPVFYRQIPYHFCDFADAPLRDDIACKIKIKSSDSEFEKLFKLGKLSYYNQDFYIKS